MDSASSTQVVTQVAGQTTLRGRSRIKYGMTALFDNGNDKRGRSRIKYGMTALFDNGNDKRGRSRIKYGMTAFFDNGK